MRRATCDRIRAGGLPILVSASPANHESHLACAIISEAHRRETPDSSAILSPQRAEVARSPWTAGRLARRRHPPCATNGECRKALAGRSDLRASASAFFRSPRSAQSTASQLTSQGSFASTCRASLIFSSASLSLPSYRATLGENPFAQMCPAIHTQLSRYTRELQRNRSGTSRFAR